MLSRCGFERHLCFNATCASMVAGRPFGCAIVTMVAICHGLSRFVLQDELRNEILDKFAIKPLWRLKEINKHLLQPESYLMTNLKALCDYHRRGKDKGCYELKEGAQCEQTHTASP